jgi:hypothetical protein
MTTVTINETFNMFGERTHRREFDVERAVDLISGINRYARAPVTFEVMKLNGMEFVVMWDDIPTYRDAQLVLVGVERIIGPNCSFALALGGDEWGVGVPIGAWYCFHTKYWLVACLLQVIMEHAESYDFWRDRVVIGE